MAPTTDTNHNGRVVSTAETKTAKWGNASGELCFYQAVERKSSWLKESGRRKRGALTAALQPFVKNCRSSESGFIMNLSMHNKAPGY